MSNKFPTAAVKDPAPAPAPAPKTPEAPVEETFSPAVALGRLEAALATAEDRKAVARNQRDKAEWKTHQDATADLRRYGDDVVYKRKKYHPAEERELTLRFLDAVLDNPDWILAEARGSLRVVDRGPQREYDEAAAAVIQARNDRDRFEAKHRSEIEADHDARDAAQIREALQGDDPKAIRQAISGAKEFSGLTSSDVRR